VCLRKLCLSRECLYSRDPRVVVFGRSNQRRCFRARIAKTARILDASISKSAYSSSGLSSLGGGDCRYRRVNHRSESTELRKRAIRKIGPLDLEERARILPERHANGACQPVKVLANAGGGRERGREGGRDFVTY
jgi:hypothetical protein